MLADFYSGLRIIDISNPENPIESGFFETSEMAKDIDVKGDYVYLANGNVGLYVLKNELSTEIYMDRLKKLFKTIGGWG